MVAAPHGGSAAAAAVGDTQSNDDMQIRALGCGHGGAAAAIGAGWKKRVAVVRDEKRPSLPVSRAGRPQQQQERLQMQNEASMSSHGKSLFTLAARRIGKEVKRAVKECRKEGYQPLHQRRN